MFLKFPCINLFYFQILQPRPQVSPPPPPPPQVRRLSRSLHQTSFHFRMFQYVFRPVLIGAFCAIKSITRLWCFSESGHVTLSGCDWWMKSRVLHVITSYSSRQFQGSRNVNNQSVRGANLRKLNYNNIEFTPLFTCYLYIFNNNDNNNIFGLNTSI